MVFPLFQNPREMCPESGQTDRCVWKILKLEHRSPSCSSETTFWTESSSSSFMWWFGSNCTYVCYDPDYNTTVSTSSHSSTLSVNVAVDRSTRGFGHSLMPCIRVTVKYPQRSSSWFREKTGDDIKSVVLTDITDMVSIMVNKLSYKPTVKDITQVSKYFDHHKKIL